MRVSALHCALKSPKTMLLLAGVLFASQLWALTLTPDQQKMVQNLTPAQKSALMAKFGGGASMTSSTSSIPLPASDAATQNPPINEIVDGSNARSLNGVEMRAQGKDTLLLTVAPEGKSTNLQMSPQVVVSLIGKSVQQLDANGLLTLPNLPTIPLLGLSASEIQARLGAEPAFKGFSVEVQILPLEPYDTGALKPFGYDFFNATRVNTSLAGDMPIPSNYPIGPGDIVNIQLFGKSNASYSLQVNREGQLDLPEIGPITVAGLTYAQLKGRIQGRVGQQMIGVTPSIALGQLRSIQIFIAGEVNYPGTFTVNALSSVTNALLASGGVKVTGSLRKIEVKRKGRVVSTLDLYDLLLKGDSGDDVTLQQGDVVFIPPVGTTVTAVGEVKRPAIYELKDETTVAELLQLAGGELPTSFIGNSKLERISALGEHTVLDIDLKQGAGAATKLQNGDVVRIPSILEESADIVVLEGHLYRPGVYQWHAGMRVSDVVSSIDKLLARPDLDYALIVREQGPQRLLTTIAFQPEKIFAAPKSELDLQLQPRDKIRFFSFIEPRQDAVLPIIEELKKQASAGSPEMVVSISGLVRNPGDYPLSEGMRVGDLMRAAGGLNQAAYDVEAELMHQVVRDNQRITERTVVNLAALDGAEHDNPLLKPFDRLEIRLIPQWREKEIVELFGEVRFPGKYTIQPGETLNEILQRAGGLTSRAYPRGAVFTREDLRKKEQENIDQLKIRLRQDIAAISLEQATNDPTTKAQSVSMSNSLLAQLETTEATGRLVIDLPAIADGNKRVDVAVKDGDKLYVPKRPEEVTVIGEVNYGTSHFWDHSLSRDDYIDRSGGLTYKADADRIYVVRANGEVAATKARWWWFNGKPAVETGDVIVVPLDAERIRPLTLWTNVSQIFYQIGVAAAAWKTIGVF